MASWKNVFKNLKITGFVFLLQIILSNERVVLPHELTMLGARLIKVVNDISRDTLRRIEELEILKQDHINNAAYEIGYIHHVMHEKYRKMLTRYNISKQLGSLFYFAELVMSLEEIELLYWDLEHLSYMAHEIERKYGINSSMHEVLRDYTSLEKKEVKKKKRQEQLDLFAHYGGGIDSQASSSAPGILNDTIFNELSWSVRMLVLKDVLKDEPTHRSMSPPPGDEESRRIPSIESLVAGRRQDDEPVSRDPNEDDNNMRIKLFRLMYETVRDSDLKCKRAELIKNHYANSSSFEIGYLMGDVMDKFNIMSDISSTLKRLFHEWKPIEHINAYEQISNQAVEINHLIDMMQGISKKNDTRLKK